MATSVAAEQLTAPRARVPRYTRFDFWLDIVLFVAFTLDFNLEFTGIPVLEWLGAAFGIALVVHLVSHWDWVVKTSRKILGKHPTKERIKWVVDLGLMALMTWTVVSGIVISVHMLPALGFTGSKANGIMKYIRQTAAALATLTVMVLLAFALKATPVSSLLSDGGGGRDQPGGPSRDNGGPGGRNASFNPVGIVGSAQSVVPQAAIIAAIALFEKRRRQQRTAALRGSLSDSER